MSFSALTSLKYCALSFSTCACARGLLVLNEIDRFQTTTRDPEGHLQSSSSCVYSLAPTYLSVDPYFNGLVYTELIWSRLIGLPVSPDMQINAPCFAFWCKLRSLCCTISPCQRCLFIYSCPSRKNAYSPLEPRVL